jgi:predicted Zn-dependent protease
MSDKEDKVREKLKQDPGNPLFAEFAEYLRKKQCDSEAITVCLTGLSNNPSCHLGRLVLARLYCSLGYIPFAARELETLYEANTKNESLARLVRLLNPTYQEKPTESSRSKDTGNETMIAETSFDLDDFDLLER